MNCASCGEVFNDGVQCSACKKQYDFGCANITESGYRRLGAERRASWKCSSCRLRSPSPLVTVTPAHSPDISLETIMTKLNAMALNLECLPALIEDVKIIKADISRLQESSKGITKKIQECDTRVKKLDLRVASLETSSSEVSELKSQISFQRSEVQRDQWSRLNNVEIKGVPIKKSENLYAIVEKIGNTINYKITKNHINYVSRIPSYLNKVKAKVISFLNRYVKEDFVASARLVKSITAADLGFTGENNNRIFVNDHLSPEYKKLLTKTKQLAKEKDFQYVSSASELISRRGVFSRRQYGSIEQLSASGDAGGALDAVIRRYRLENGNSLGEKDELFGPPSAPVLENPEFQTRWYFKYFLGKMHQNYIGLDGTREPYLLSVVQESGGGLLRAILFNKMGAHKIYLPPSAWSGGGGQAATRPTIKQILAQFPAMERVDKVPREITCPELQKDILLLEEQEGSVNFKIGVMLMNLGQKTDDEMLSNEKGDEKWDRFISLLGDKIRLRGWNRFRGGLDVKGDMTGCHAIYTMHQGHEIMFHVSTMLPFSKDNKQQLERKRHIGNDIVNIVFTDDAVHNAFNPQCVKSHFTHIFAVVSEVEGEGYRLSVYSDDNVPPFGPSLPCPPVFNDAQLFREFLLVKVMNGEKAAFQTPTFALKRQRTLDTLIRDIYAEHCSDHKVPMLSRRALSDVWSGGAGAGGAGAARTERFLHVGQALKLDAVLRGDAPTSLVSTGSGGSRRAPWEGRIWRAAPLPATPVCAEQLSEGRLLLSTTSNTYILEDSGTTRVILRWEGCVRAARVTERAGLFRVGAKLFAGGGSTTGGAGGAGLYALPLSELSAGAWAMRPLQDCKHARLPRTKTAQCFDILETGEGGKTTLAVSIGRRVMLLVEELKTDSEMGFEYTHIKDIQLSETPVLIKLMEFEVGVMVVGYKHHWEVLETITGQAVKRSEADDSINRRGTLVNALRIGDERDGQIVLCYNHTCHFERLTPKGLESDGEYDFHWTTVPAAVVCAFPYIMAFAEDLLEIRLVANGSLVHAACIPGLKLLCGRRDIFYVACAPEYVPLSREIDPCLLQHDNYELVRQMNKTGPYSVDEDDNHDKGDNQSTNPTSKTSETNSASSRSSSLSSEQENIRPPLQRMAPVSPPSSPQVLPENSGRCVRIYKIPQSNLSAGAYQRQSLSTDQVVTSYFSERPNSTRQRLAELKLDSKSRGGGEDETL